MKFVVEIFIKEECSKHIMNFHPRFKLSLRYQNNVYLKHPIGHAQTIIPRR